MNPTNEQLDIWSAEALGYDELDGWDKCLPPDLKEYWHPSSDLSQAWQEFVPALQEMNLWIELTANRRCDDIVMIKGGPYTSGQGETSDQRAAYAITYAFVRTMKPSLYLEWRAKELSSERSEQ